MNSASEASVLQQEVSSLLLKEAIEGVSSSDLHRGFYQPVFSSSKEGWGVASYIRSVQAELLPLQREIQDADAQEHSFPGPRGGLVHHG